MTLFHNTELVPLGGMDVSEGDELLSNISAELRIGILGLGRAGISLIPAIEKHPFIRLAAGATRDKLRREAFVRDYQVPVYETAEELCNSENIDAIYIATPTELHTEHVKLAAKHHKHIIVEKPLAISLKDVDEIIEAVEQNKVCMIVGHSHSFELPIKKMYEVIQSGELGSLRMVHNWYYNDWLYRPRTPQELDTELGGGITYRQGSHQFDIIRYLAGGVTKSVRASTGIWDPDRPTEGSHTAFLEFDNGVVATAIYNGYDHFHTTELTFGIGEASLNKKEKGYGSARKIIKNLKNSAEEVVLKNASGYGGIKQKSQSQEEASHPFFGLTVVSCERGDIRQSPEGLFVYGQDEKYEIPLSKEATGRDAVVAELYDSVMGYKRPIHDGRWAKANLEICIGVLESSKQRKELFLKYQIPVEH